MARRSDHSREELFELAIGAAGRIVEAEGFQALTARRVAEAIGYSPGTLYNLFANLDELIVHLNGRTLDALHERLAASPPTGAPAADLARLLDGYLAFIDERPNLWAALFEHHLPPGQDVPDWYGIRIGRVLGMLEAALAPLFGPDGEADRHDAAVVLWAGLHGVCSLSGDDKLSLVTARSRRHLAELLVGRLVAGLAQERTTRRG